MPFKPVSRLTKIFSSVIMSGLALVSSHAWASEAQEEQGPPSPEPVATQVEEYRPMGREVLLPRDTRRMEEREDDLFSRRYNVQASRENIWIGSPQRFDIMLMPVQENGLFQVTREYIEIRPLKKEWYGLASGIEYGFDANIGPGRQSGLAEWDFRTGMKLGYYHGEQGERSLDNNTRVSAFVEGARPVTFGDTSAYVITGISFNSASGPDVGKGQETRVYTELDFPALFGMPQSNNTAFGRFSATLRAYAGTQTYGGQLGIYFNDLKSDGKGLNFSAGPEIRYDQREGVSYRFKFRVSPKFW